MNPILDKKTEQFVQELKAAGGPPIYKLPVREARKVLEDLQAKPVEKMPVHIEDRMFPGGPQGHVSVRIIRPEVQGDLPAVIYCHGGGWILGSKETHDRLVREIACGAHAAVVFINYTPSPEARYPQAIEEAYGAMKYVVEHGKALHIDSSRMAVAGDSVGGNMAIALTLLAKEKKGPKIDFQLLFYPVTDANFNNGSYREFAEGPWLTKPAMEWFWNAYEPSIEARKKITVCPLHASIEQLRHLPPALIITDENDVLRDEGEAYGRKLLQAGVDAAIVRYSGTHHDFVMLNPLKDSPAARSAIGLAVGTLQKVFSSRGKMHQKGVA